MQHVVWSCVMVRVGIIGASGYTGAELLRLLAGHPEMDLVFATADRNAGGAAADLYPSLAASYPGLLFEPFDVDRVADLGLDVVFLGLPHEASMALAPAACRHGRVHRRPVGGIPAQGRVAVPTVVRVRARSAGPPGRRRVRAARADPRRSCGRPADRHARLLRHGRDARAGTAARRWSDRAHRDHRRRGERCLRRRPVPTADDRVLHRRRELHRLRAAGPSPHARDRAEPRRRGAVHAAPGADEPGDPRHLLRPARRARRRRPTIAARPVGSAYADEPFVVVTEARRRPRRRSARTRSTSPPATTSAPATSWRSPPSTTSPRALLAGRSQAANVALGLDETAGLPPSGVMP